MSRRVSGPGCVCIGLYHARVCERVASNAVCGKRSQAIRSSNRKSQSTRRRSQSVESTDRVQAVKNTHKGSQEQSVDNIVSQAVGGGMRKLVENKMRVRQSEAQGVT